MKLSGNSRTALLAVCLAFAAIDFVRAASAPSTPVVKVVRVGDVELHYVEQGTGVPVIFVHGSVDDYRTFEPQLEPLSKRYRVISYSRRYNFPNARRVPSGNHSALVEADDLAKLLNALGAYPAHVVGHSYGAYTALILAMKHPELVRSVVLAEPPLLRWLPGLPGGQRLYDDFMNGVWNPTGREFRRGNSEQAMRLTVDWFGRNGYLIDGKPALFETLPAETRGFIMENALEWQALTTSSDAFPMLDRVGESHQSTDPPDVRPKHDADEQADQCRAGEVVAQGRNCGHPRCDARDVGGTARCLPRARCLLLREALIDSEPAHRPKPRASNIVRSTHAHTRFARSPPHRHHRLG